MSKYENKIRKRRKTLFIVEGNHEKNVLFELMIACFPELDIKMDDIWIYGTNIYMLYEDIKNEYGCDWVKYNDDIDLPYVISKKKNMKELRYKEDFINIILVFDYERHDPRFSVQKIEDMQKIFIDVTDMGKLYINYPMIESYQNFKSLPDNEFINRKILETLQRGAEYKRLVQNESMIQNLIGFKHKIEDTLHKSFHILDDKIRMECCDRILNISDDKNLLEKLHEVLESVICEDELQTAKYQYKHWIMNMNYLNKKMSYWGYMREIFKQIIYHNIRKAEYIQNNHEELDFNKYRECFDTLDLIKILKIQNDVSSDVETGFIWVLSTCLFLIPDYNFSLIETKVKGYS